VQDVDAFLKFRETLPFPFASEGRSSVGGVKACLLHVLISEKMAREYRILTISIMSSLSGDTLFAGIGLSIRVCSKRGLVVSVCYFVCVFG
jgi:hypothetical protein